LYTRLIIIQTLLQKWGNSLGVRIPRALAEEVDDGPGSEVSLSTHEGSLILKPSFPTRMRLDDLLAAISPENLHTSVDTGEAVGMETY
jgi:antitoxin MazE